MRPNEQEWSSDDVAGWRQQRELGRAAICEPFQLFRTLSPPHLLDRLLHNTVYHPPAGLQMLRKAQWARVEIHRNRNSVDGDCDLAATKVPTADALEALQEVTE
jgi:hypothetical protein